MFLKKSPQELAYFILRFGMGINLMSHGLVRFGSNFAKFHDWMLKLFAETWLPSVLVSLSAYLIPPTEFTLGLLLIIGFKTKEAVFFSGMMICALIFGMSLVQNWEVVGSQMIYLICNFFLLLYIQFNANSLDEYLDKTR